MRIFASKLSLMVAGLAFIAGRESLAQSAATDTVSQVEWKASPGARGVSGMAVTPPADSLSLPATVSAASELLQPTPKPPPVVIEPAPMPPPTAPAANLPTELPAPASDAGAGQPTAYLKDSAAAPGRIWGSAEYLMWWLRGNSLPPLVTTAPIGVLGTLDNPQTHILYGNQQALTNPFNGMRFRAGVWFDKCETCGLDAGFFGFGTTTNSFLASSNGDPGLFRPFFNTSTHAPDAELVALQLPKRAGGYDPILTGAVAVNNATNFYGWDVNFRKLLCAEDCYRVDVLVGWRYLRLQDATSIQENLLSTDPLEVAAPLNTRILVYDRFQTTNTFNGANLGLVGERRWGRFFGNLRTTVAFGVNHEQTKIEGSTQVITPTGVAQTFNGGLLALPSNIGSYSTNQFGFITELGGNFGYQVSSHLRVFAGYSFLNWSAVARSGGQIDTVLNPSYIPNNGPATGPARPTYHLNQTDFYAHGYNVGLQFAW